MLPRVKIIFENGALGSVALGTDGVVGLVSTAAPVAQKFALGQAYVLRSLDDLVTLGISSAANDTNAFLYKHVKGFYDEAGDGAELWIMGFPNTKIQSDLADKAQDTAKLLIQAAQGSLKVLAVAFNPSGAYEQTTANGLDADVATAMQKAQELSEWATDVMYAPLFVLLEARGFSGDVTALADLSPTVITARDCCLATLRRVLPERQ
jgi:hypothetical protein